MLTISIIKGEDSANIFQRKKVKVNNIFDTESMAFKSKKDSRDEIFLYNHEAIDAIENASFSEVEKYVSKVRLIKEHIRNYRNIEIDFSDENKEKILKLYIQIDVKEWVRPYSVGQFINKVESLTNSRNERFTFFIEDPMFSSIGDFGLKINVDNLNQKIGESVSAITYYTNEIIAEANSNLIDEADSEVISTFFKFPPQFKIASKQYLMYFAQFLLDMGIDAETEIREGAHETLFKIIPKDKTESLEKIREALTIFLNMPAMSEAEMQMGGGDIAVMQLQANVMHFKSQLMLATSVIQMKDATIESLKLTNYQYEQDLKKKGLDKLKNDEESVIPGIMSLKKYEGKGFSIDLPELLRRLKRRF